MATRITNSILCRRKGLGDNSESDYWILVSNVASRRGNTRTAKEWKHVMQQRYS